MELTPSNLPGHALWQAQRPPTRLFVRGKWGPKHAHELLRRLPEDGLACVGTRRALPSLLHQTRNWILALRDSRIVVISGLAKGVDTVAHTAALEAGLPTIAVVGAGLDVSYPPENHALGERIVAAGGLILSEFPLGTKPLAAHFIHRNRLIARLAKAVWVVQAAHRSGALNTARWARDMDIDCYAVPCRPGDPALAGNQRLIDDNHARPFWGPHSLGATWFELSSTFEAKDSSAGTRAPAIQLLQKVYSASRSRGGISVQDLHDWAMQTGWPSEKFFSALEVATETGSILDKNGILTSVKLN
ncbi:MAG: DNA-processing protein DprA [Bacteriovoracia bacterium]